MICAAIYARRSKEQDDAEDESKSVNRQVENARVFVAAKGWTVAEEHIYIDDGISGASSLARLRAKARMLDAITASKTPPFDVLICQAADRFSRRDGDESFGELKTIAKAGVQVWFYSDGSRFQFGDFASNTLSFLKGEFAAEYRRAISVKTAEAMKRKAERGHVTGGRVFGYDNVEVDKHVERIINHDEAAVVSRIFDLCSTGAGYSRIAKMLNAERAVCPRPQQGRPAGWSPSTVRDVLHRDLYRGELIWNRTKKRDRSGDVAPTVRPTSEWLHVSRPDLRIVSDEQWNAAHPRIRRAQSATNYGPVVRDLESKYLLAGFARCAVCGGSLSVVSRQHGTQRRFFYACLAYHKRGASVCPNALQVPMERVDRAVLTALAADVLRPEIITGIIGAVFEQLKPANVESNVALLKRDLGALDRKIANLAAAVEQGGADIPPLVAQLRDRQAQREHLMATITAAETVDQIQADRAAIEAKVQEHMANWRALLTSDVARDGRQLLREILEAPLRFTPEGRAYRFIAPVATGRVVAGLAGVSTWVASPRGKSPGCTGEQLGWRPWRDSCRLARASAPPA